MTTLEDLPNKSIGDMSVDEAIELLRTIRLTRRTGAVTRKTKAISDTKARKKSAPKLSPEDARKLLEMLGG